MAKGKDKHLQSAEVNQGGGTMSSSKFRQQSSVGGTVAATQLKSALSIALPGFFGASGLASPTTVVPVTELDIKVVYAKTQPGGPEIPPAAWQTDNSPIVIWEPPPTGPPVAGYSYAIDQAPDDVIDTTATSFDVATAIPATLPDGKHAFSVKALNTAGNSGKTISLELWVDTSPPQITSYSPAPGSLLSAFNVPAGATVADAGSGVSATTVKLLLNGSSVSALFDQTTGTLTASSLSWKEGANSLELRVADAVGNALTPLIWSATVDTKPPRGSVTINGDDESTRSIYVTLGLDASDATSGVARIQVSNEELTGYVEEPYVTLRELWKLTPMRGLQKVYVKFIDHAGNISEPVSDGIELTLLSPETVITSGPAGFAAKPTVSFTFMCPEGGCVFAVAFDNDDWSAWGTATSAARTGLAVGNHYFRVKAAKEHNGQPGIQPDEEDPSPAERTWIVGQRPPVLTLPKGSPIKLWRLD